MSWYPLHDVKRLGPLWRHRMYATSIVSLLLLLLSLLLVADPAAQCLVAGRAYLPAAGGHGPDEPARWQRLQQAAFDPDLLAHTCRAARLQPKDLELADLAHLAQMLQLRVTSPPGAPAVAVQFELWTARPSAGRRLIDAWARAVGDVGLRMAQEHEDHAAVASWRARETVQWEELQLALTRYLDAVAALMDEYFAGASTGTVPTGATRNVSWPVSTGSPHASLPLNPQWLALSAELESLEAQLHESLRIYADKHPLIVQLRTSIELVAARLDELPMAIGSPVAETEQRTHISRSAGKFDLGILEESRRELRRAVDDYLELRETAASRGATDDAYAVQRGASVPARVSARRGGWQAARLALVVATSVVAGFTVVLAGLGPRSERLRSADEFQQAWGGELIGVLGDASEGSATGNRHTAFLRLLRAAEWGVVVCLIGLALVALADPDFLAHLCHDPRLAFRDWLSRR